MKYGYIYLTTNLITNKKYIGLHRSYKKDQYIGSGIILKEAIKKYGKENFHNKIIQWCDSEKELLESEYFWIKESNAIKNKNFYNISSGGISNDISIVGRDKISKALRGKKKTNIHNKKNSESNRKRWNKIKKTKVFKKDLIMSRKEASLEHSKKFKENNTFKEKHREGIKKSWTEERKRKQSKIFSIERLKKSNLSTFHVQFYKKNGHKKFNLEEKELIYFIERKRLDEKIPRKLNRKYIQIRSNFEHWLKFASEHNIL